MLIQRVSPHTGELNSKEIDCTEEQYKLYEGGLQPRLAFPHLGPSEWEFILTGCTDEDWEDIFKHTKELDKDVNPDNEP
jgi:hypothetical protein